MKKVWLTGDAVVDLIPDTEMTYLKCPGGAPANVAVGVARLGGDVGFFGRVGGDPFGRFLKETLNKENVGTGHLVLDADHRTSTVVVELDAHGERSFTFMVKPSADQFLQPQDIPAFSAGEWLHTCSISLANEPSRRSTFGAMEAIKAAGGFISFDPNLREEVWQNPDEIRATVMRAVAMADVVKFSDDELLFLTGTNDLDAALDAVKPLNIPMILITQGARGAWLVMGDNKALVTGKSVSPVDTTGAGDAFVGGLLAYLSRVDDWQQQDVAKQAVVWANACGALSTTQKGAMTALPDLESLERFIQN
ncbi:aminoimidazole riboside kinase [Enterovibrio paralichthyis]|uniref:aminoimidazole riboside kinase n=1 Tax=Enterovibrio paralichthyis TaxID=2853805 RepID=UPI001C438EDD|nr:aminoimidazole riboside kinase [Enterovibrio paralichthyis]MBV7297319.1 aminoimidazole riboside kinase [Enterovibrio paralichthyis]